MLDALAALAQTLSYCGVLCGAGAVLATATLQPSLSAADTFVRQTRAGAWLTIVATLFALGILVLRLGDSLDATILSAVLMSNVGAAAGLRLSGAVLLLVTPVTEDDGFGRGMHMSAAVLVLASFVFSGHAAAEGVWPGLVAALHVAAAGWWVSSLLAMRMAFARGDVTAVALVRRFSALAVIAIGVLLAAGGVLIFALIDFSAFEVTPYVRNLIVKLAIVFMVLGIAAYNRFALTAPVLANESIAIARLRRAVNIELLLIGFVLIATAIMTTYSSPHA
jgi:putative copper export protein